MKLFLFRKCLSKFHKVCLIPYKEEGTSDFQSKDHFRFAMHLLHKMTST